jgi:mannose-1-phosphate guanylyltransferase
MAGGSGTRFWPKSRAKKPKQLLALWDDKTLIEHTVRRFADRVPLDQIWIVTTEALVAPTREVLGPKYSQVRFLGEPAAKNTAPCILWGLHEIKKVNTGATVAVMPADHFIGDEKSFHDALDVAIAHAKSAGGLVTLGIKPNAPETGYGYIEIESRIDAARGAAPIKQFVEKPDLRTANRYMESGRYLWNAGMFIMTALGGIEAFRKTMPPLANLFEGALHVEKIYPQIDKQNAQSIDYGVMEQAVSKGIPVSVVPVDCGWNDVGSFPALEEINAAVQGQVVSLASGSNVVHTDTGLVALLGVNDIVVVRDGDVVLVAAKDRAQDIKALLEKVKAAHPDLA